ncbi:hypothetical protein ACTXT7_004605 [Hymenolepis weldensis]
MWPILIGEEVYLLANQKLAKLITTSSNLLLKSGSWRPASMGRQIQVAVKVLDLDRFPTKMDDFLKEAAIMNALDHPDIVRLYGICVAPKCLRLVTELAPLRSLLECLREPDLRTSFPVSTLHSFAIQIARGMTYLEEERLVHRDLAARNILVFDKDRVKIGDFGLSRALQLGKSYYKTNFNANLRLPIAWCALEAIHELRFTSASDVWSYGVTLWEMFTYGFVPWAGLSGRQILEAVDAPNCQRLSQPDACPDAVFDAVIRACWNHEPTSRPTFAQLTEMLPHLSPQAWSVVESSNQLDSEPFPRTVDDIRNLLTENQNGNSNEIPDIDCEGSNKPLLRVRAGETVYVLSKKDPELWKVASHSSCQVGYIPPENLRMVQTESSALKSTSKSQHQNSNDHTGGTLSRMRLRFSRRGSVGPESYSQDAGGQSMQSPKGGKKFNRDLISLPQNDFRHVGHVGVDGTIFGDVGFALDDVDEDDKDPSPAGSCMTIGSASDKENPRLSDTTLGERSSRRSSVGIKSIPPTRNTVPTVIGNSNGITGSLSSPSENSRLTSSCFPSKPLPSSPPPPPASSTMDSTSWFTSTSATNDGVDDSEPSFSFPLSTGEELDDRSAHIQYYKTQIVDPTQKELNASFMIREASILDMGSSFMDEIFQCLSAKTEGLNLLDSVSPSTTTETNHTASTTAELTVTGSEPPKPIQQTPESPRMENRRAEENQALPLPPAVPKPARSRELTPLEESNHNVTNGVDSSKRLSVDQTNGDRYERSNSVGVSGNLIGSHTSLIDTTSSPFHRGHADNGRSSNDTVGTNDGNNNSTSGRPFMNATSTLTRAFRKSSASLSRRPDKAPSALSLEQSSSTNNQMPPIKGRLEGGAGGKSKRPIISGPVMISNPTLVTGVSVTSIISEGTTTGAVSTPPSSSSPSLRGGNSRGSSITTISSPLSLGQGSQRTPGGQTTPVTTTSTTTPSISPAPSTSSLATSSTSSSNLGLHQHYPTSTTTGRIHGTNNTTTTTTTGWVTAGGVGLRALRDRGDLVFRAPAAVGGVGGTGRRTRVNQGVLGSGEYQPRSIGITSGGTLDRGIRPQLPICPATVTLPRRTNHFGLRDRNSVDTSETNGNAVRISSYSTRERVIDQVASNHLPSQSSSVVTPTALDDYSLIPPPPAVESQIQRKVPPPTSEADSSTEQAMSSSSAGLSEELLSFWGSEFASLLGSSASAST